MASASATAGKWLIRCGIALLLPSACSVASTRLSSGADDAAVALTPIARVPLSSLAQGVAFLYRVPTSDQWTRIRSSAAMGDNGFAVFAVAGSHDVIPFGPLGISVSVTGKTGGIRVERLDRVPFLYVSNDNRDIGVRFNAAPGEELQISIKSNAAELPKGELVI